MGGWPRGDAFVGSYFNAASKKGGGAGGGVHIVFRHAYVCTLLPTSVSTHIQISLV